MTVYELQTQIEQIVGRINGRSRVNWAPVKFFFRALPFEEVVSHDGGSWITRCATAESRGKEYVAAQVLPAAGRCAVGVRRCGRGVSRCRADQSARHRRSDRTPRQRSEPGQAQSRLRELFAIVEHNDIRMWGEAFIDAVRSSLAADEAAVVTERGARGLAPSQRASPEDSGW